MAIRVQSWLFGVCQLKNGAQKLGSGSSCRGRGVAWHGVAVLMRNDISPCLSSESSSFSAVGNEQPAQGFDKGRKVPLGQSPGRIRAKGPGGFSLNISNAAINTAVHRIVTAVQPAAINFEAR